MKSQGKYSARLSLLPLIVITSSLLVSGQTPAPAPGPGVERPAAISRLPQEADENFELNIAERRFTKENFEAATALETGGSASGVHVRIGVSLNADRIEVLLRNVHGSVRFRGTLDRILGIIGKRTTPPAEVR